jgi:multicomponent Na+:H+ antiporter subunit E
LFVLLLAIWLLWSGLYKPLVIGLGVVSCLLCVIVAYRMQAMSGARFEGWVAVRAVGYFPWLLKEITTANLTVIRIVLSPSLPITPTVVKVTGTPRTDLGRVVYGNSITLTPGTLTMDVDGDAFTVHALTRRGAEEVAGGEMNDRVTRLEGRA